MPVGAERHQLGVVAGSFGKIVFAVNRPAPLGLTEPILKALLQGAEKVHLDKGSVAVISLKVVPWP